MEYSVIRFTTQVIDLSTQTKAGYQFFVTVNVFAFKVIEQFTTLVNHT